MPKFNTYPEIGGMSESDLGLTWDAESQKVKTVKTAPVKNVASIAALKALSVTTIPDGFQVRVRSYYSGLSGGGGTFYWDSTSVATPDNGTIIAPNSGIGAWIRIYDAGEVNVRWFGAKGDGTTNDTAAFTAAIAAVGGPGTINVPKGVYLVSGAVAISLEKGQSFVGKSFGNGSSDTGSTILYVGNGTAIRADNLCSIRNIQVKGRSSGFVTGSHGIDAQPGSTSWNTSNVGVYYFDRNYYLDNTSVVTISNPYLAYGYYGILLDGSEANAITVNGGNIQDNQIGIVVAGGPHSGLSLFGISIQGNDLGGFGVQLANNGSKTFSGLAMVGCRFENNGDGVDAGYDVVIEGYYMYGGLITGNTFAVTHQSVYIIAANNLYVGANNFAPGGTIGTRKSLQLTTNSCNKCIIGPNIYLFGAFDESIDDNGIETTIFETNIMVPPPMPNGTFLQTKTNAGDIVSVIGIPVGAKYTQFSCGVTAQRAIAYALLDGNGKEIARFNSVFTANGADAAEIIFTNGVKLISGHGDPNGIVSGTVGSLFLRDDGADNTSLYIRKSTGAFDWNPVTP